MAKEKHETSSRDHVGRGWELLESGWKYVRAPLATGALEVVTFHPGDTMIKRLMDNRNPIYDGKKSFKNNVKNFSNIAFCDPKKGNFSLYPGLRWAAIYKVLQRTYKFTLQPEVESALQEYVFGNAHKVWAAAFSGALVGAGEVVLLPFDIQKIRKQTASADEGYFSWRALHVTVARNMIGSASLFGLPPLIAQLLYSKTKGLTETQKTITYVLGATGCLVASNPFDVVKTRMQADKTSPGAWPTMVKIARNNPSQFFKGIGPKTLFNVFKLTAFMEVKDKIEEWFQSDEEKNSEEQDNAGMRPK